MSESASRPARESRGRGSVRGGRGGRGGGRGTTRDRPSNGYASKDEAPADDFVNHGELGEMKKQYSEQLAMLKSIFPDWTDVDLLFALQETDGDIERTITHITEGHVSQFSDVKTAKEKSKAKPKEAPDTANSTRPTRGRGTFDASRGTRARGEGRGRGAPRGGRGATHAATNGTRAAAETAPTTTTDSGWDEPIANTDGASNSWADESAPKVTPPEPVKSSTPAAVPGQGKTWAQMFAKPPPAAPIPKKEPARETPPVADAGITPSEGASSGFEVITHEDAEPEDSTQPPPIATPGHDSSHIQESSDDTTVQLTPSKDQLTKENVEHLPSVAEPAPTGTAASTVPSSRGPDSVTPSIAGQSIAQAPIGRPPMGGYQTTAMKATGAGQRTASFNRRMAEQQEAVVMPGNHAIDMTAVQFGSLGLNGEDVDEDREELETRAQPPQHSPVAAPRASLPPVPRQAPAAAEPSAPEPVAASKPNAGLPPAPASQQHQSPAAPAAHTQTSAQGGQGYNQFGGYGQRDPQKPYDAFSQQAPHQSTYDAYPSHTQPQTQSAQQGGYSSAGPDYSQYYTADQRNAYSSYYGGSYGQQTQQEGATQQRTGSAFAPAASGEAGYPASQHNQASRFGADSGHTTPNPAAGQQGGQPHAQGQQGQQAGYQQYGSHPYQNHPYYSYVNQYPGYGQSGYGGPQGYGKGSYSQPYHGGYGNHDQFSSTPGGYGGFGGRENASVEGGYGRTASGQQGQGAQSGNSYGGNDPYSRQQYQQGYGQTQGGQQGSNDDGLKPYSSNEKASAGQSPGIGQPGRPGSAANNAGQGAQSGLPLPQSHQQGGYGGFQGHYGQQTSQHGGGLGGLGGGHTAGQQGGYGSNYGSAFGGGNSYGQQYGRGGGGGWSNQYGGH